MRFDFGGEGTPRFFGVYGLQPKGNSAVQAVRSMRVVGFPGLHVIDEEQLLDTVMAAAAVEAINGGYAEIEIAHLLMGLSRLAQVGSARTSDAISNLRSEFLALGIAPQEFRRGLRRTIGRGSGGQEGGALHRSPGCKAVFVEAERRAAAEGAEVSLVYLFRACFASLVEAGADLAKEFEVPDAL